MSYTLNQSTGGTKLLIQSGDQDYGTGSNPTYTLLQTLQAPPRTFALMGVEKMYWRQPLLFPTRMFPVTMILNYYDSYGVLQTTTTSLTFSSFLQNLQYNGNGDTGLAALLTAVLAQLNTNIPSSAGALDFMLMGSTSFTTAVDQTTLCNQWASLGHKDLKIVFKNNFTYVPTAAPTVQFIDTKPYGFASTYLGGNTTITGAATAAGYGTPISFNVLWEGRSYIKILCSAARGFRESRTYATGMIESGVLAVIPATGAPGHWEYYTSQINEGITVQDLNIDQLTFTFLDETNNELTDIVDYTFVISVDYFDRDPKNKAPTMEQGRLSMNMPS